MGDQNRRIEVKSDNARFRVMPSNDLPIVTGHRTCILRVLPMEGGSRRDLAILSGDVTRRDRRLHMHSCVSRTGQLVLLPTARRRTVSLHRRPGPPGRHSLHFLHLVNAYAALRPFRTGRSSGFRVKLAGRCGMFCHPGTEIQPLPVMATDLEPEAALKPRPGPVRRPGHSHSLRLAGSELEGPRSTST
jgi:hypothetical protein